MVSLDVSLSADVLSKRMQDRLRGLSAASPNAVLWQQRNNQVLIFVDSLRARLLTGWLLCNLDLQCDQTGRQKLQFIFYLGAPGNGDGVHAAGTINADNPQSARLAEVWGPTLQRVLWDAVLDVLEVSVEQAAAQQPGAIVALQGFQVSASSIAALIHAEAK